MSGPERATLYRLAVETGLRAGERGLPMLTLDKLADYLDLNIVSGKHKGR